MRSQGCLLLVTCPLLAGCGRVAFDVRSDDAGGDGASGADASMPDDMPADPSLVLHFTFDASVTAEARGRDATCVSCPTMVAGRVGAGAAAFDGTQCLVIGDGADVRPMTFTVATWLNVPPMTTSFMSYVSKARDGATTSNNSFELYLQGNTTLWTIVVDGIVSNTTYLPSSWHHLVGRYDGATVSIYVDGMVMGQASASSIVYTADAVRIGCDLNNNVPVSFTTGQLDDVRLYNRALSPAEIAALAAM